MKATASDKLRSKVRAQASILPAILSRDDPQPSPFFMKTETQQQIMRKSVGRLMKRLSPDSSITLTQQETERIIFSVIEQAHQNGWHEGRNYEAKFGVKPEHRRASHWQVKAMEATKRVLKILNESNPSLLHQHDAEMRKPLVDALQESRYIIASLRSFVLSGESLTAVDEQNIQAIFDTIDALAKQ